VSTGLGLRVRDPGAGLAFPVAGRFRSGPLRAEEESPARAGTARPARAARTANFAGTGPGLDYS